MPSEVMTDLYKKLCTQYFKEFLMGRLWEGVVHNINSPLQIVSMNLEILKMKKESDPSFPEPLWDRIQQITESVDRIQDITNILVKRKEYREGESTAVILEEILKNELEFWISDLFFKHNIKKHIMIRDRSNVVIVNAPSLIDLIDAAFALQIAMLKITQGEELIFTLQVVDGPGERFITIMFDRTGPRFKSVEGSLESGDSPDPHFFELCAYVLQSTAQELGCALSIEGTTISVELPKAPRP